MNDHESNSTTVPLYRRIYAMARRVPAGKVATYGQIADLVDCTARTVGYAMAAVPDHLGVPWHRVINSQGRVSVRADGQPSTSQRRLLEDEGIDFDRFGRVDLERVRWSGP